MSVGYLLAADAATALLGGVVLGNGGSLTDTLLSHVADVLMAATVIFSALFERKMAIHADTETQIVEQDWICARSCIFFALIFSARWFKHYSLILAGERRDKIGTALEHLLCDFANVSLVDRVFYIATNVVFFTMYLGEAAKTNSVSTELTQTLQLLHKVVHPMMAVVTLHILV